jgi:BolA protein
MNRIELIRQCLVKALSPTHLLIQDESHEHIGHPGAKSGGGHYAIEVGAACLQNINRVTAHRMIYAALAELMTKEIHALKINII